MALSEFLETNPTIRQPSGEWIAMMVERCAHGGRPEHPDAFGCQRERRNDLGFGWIYFALARAAEAQRALVVGTGRGFSAACLALAIEHLPSSKVTILDPGYSHWLVDGQVPDEAEGIWRDEQQVRDHFAPLGLRNIELLRKRSDDGFEDFRTRGESFDIILIDGNHGYEQCVKDLRNALSLLKQTGFIILHDTYCQEWPGVALAVDTLQQENLAIDKVALPLWPGIAILQKTRPITMIRRISSEENKQVNEWRRHAGITTRPLPDGDDPRPEETFEDSRIGLFAVLCDGKLAGGFGVRSRTFRQAGEDDFAPDGEGPLSGFLVYGAVLRPEVHGLGVHDFVQRELLRWFGSTGYYAITEFPKETVSIASSEIVGRAGDYRAYHVRPFYASDKPLFSLFRRLRIMHSERRLKLEVADLTRAVTEKDRRNEDLQQKLAAEAQRANEEIADLRRAVTEKDVRNEDLQQKLAAETQRANEEIADLRQELMRIQRSRSWRWTTALRGIAGFLRRCIFYLQSRHAWK